MPAPMPDQNTGKLDASRPRSKAAYAGCVPLIEGSGHMIPIEQPEALAAVIVPWLREMVRPTAT